MRKSERALRRDAYMAHLIQGYEEFGGAIKDPLNSDILHQRALKGVQVTQFLYNNAHRPMFAQTSLGKVYSRFQLWAWNSVKLRNDLLRQAEVYGFQPETQAFENMRRLMITDIFTLALASTFRASLVEATLPAPLSWFQDAADWLFGNDETRERAFFGSYPTALAPLQVVTPPSMRLLPPVFKGLTNGEWDRLSNYYIWTMFPFGRLTRDVLGSIDNPIMTVNKMTGFPYIQMQREMNRN